MFTFCDINKQTSIKCNAIRVYESATNSQFDLMILLNNFNLLYAAADHDKGTIENFFGCIIHIAVI